MIDRQWQIEGVTVNVTRKRCRCINLRVKADGGVYLTIPKYRATLREGEEYLRKKWPWVMQTRARLLASPVHNQTRSSVTAEEIAAFAPVLDAIHSRWAMRVGETGVAWRIRRVKSFWGCCHWRSRYVTYNAELARMPPDIVEYVVAHEFTHFTAHNHGSRFCELMDARLPSWRTLRKELNGRSLS